MSEVKAPVGRRAWPWNQWNSATKLSGSLSWSPFTVSGKGKPFLKGKDLTKGFWFFFLGGAVSLHFSEMKELLLLLSLCSGLGIWIFGLQDTCVTFGVSVSSSRGVSVEEFLPGFGVLPSFLLTSGRAVQNFCCLVLLCGACWKQVL